MSDFLISYPALFLLDEHESPELVEVDGELCLCLFTDVDLAQRFHREKYGRLTGPVQALAAGSRGELLRILEIWRPALEEGLVRCVAYDVSLCRRPMYGTIAALLGMLKADSDD